MESEDKSIKNPAQIPWWRWGKIQNVAIILVGVLGVYGLIYMDVVSRAKEAYNEGEKYMAWHEDLAAKKQYFEAKFEEEKQSLTIALKKKKITDNEFREKVDSLEFDRDFRIKESSLKYAYQWFKDTYELFSPPESKWVKMARKRTPEALALWKEELKGKNIPIEDYMFE